MTFRRNSVVLSALLAAACGGGSIASGDLLSQYSNAYCQKLISCCPGTAGLPSQADCVAALELELGPSIQAELANTTLSYHGDVASSCLSAVSAASCGDAFLGDSTVSLPACTGIFTGSVAIGGACSGDDAATECQSGLCGNITGSNASAAGTCAAPVASGGTCLQGGSYGEMCASGSFEDLSGAGCVCSPRKPNGDACESEEECISGYCDSTSSTCAAVPATLSASYCASVVSSTN